MDSNLRNVLMLCLAYTFVIASFQTTTGLQNLIFKSVKSEDPNFDTDQYTGLLIFYVVYAISQWAIPSFIAISGPRFGMFVGSVSFLIFVLQLLYPVQAILLSMNVIMGAGAALLWNAHGTYIARCSDMTTATMHSGIYWTMYYTCALLASLLVHFVFKSKTYMNTTERMSVLGVLLVIMVIGVGSMALMRRVETNQSPDLEQELSLSCAWYTFKALVKLFISKDMLILSAMFIYTGLHQGFCSSTFGIIISNTLWIAEDPWELSQTATLVRNGSAVVGAIGFALLGNYTTRWGRDPMVAVAGLMHLVGAILIYINIPDEATHDETEEMSVLDPPLPWVALLCAFLLSCGTSISTVHIYSMLIGTFVANSTGAVCVFKMLQSIALCVSFIYSSNISAYAQLGILIVFDVLGVLGFCYVEFKAKQGDLGPPYEVIMGVGT